MSPKQRIARFFLAAALSAAAVAPSKAGADAPPPTGPFGIKPPDMTLPAGAKRGTVRRIIQPFGPWTLICDENLTARTRVCNVSQTIIDATGRTIFSWSLAASQDGAPVFIVRMPAALANDHFVQIIFGRKAGREMPLQTGVILSLCDAATCLGYLNVDKKIQQQIARQSDVAIKVLIGSRSQTFETSLDGLSQAVASLDGKAH